MPDGCYLAGGAAIGVHLRHRVSRNLDFFFHDEIDLDALTAESGPRLRRLVRTRENRAVSEPLQTLVPRQLERLDGSETIGDTCGTISEFWSWAYSDLRSNTERGIFAEYLVARAVGDTTPLRVSWANHDVTTPSGIRVEVKATGYLQSWTQKRLSTPSFGRLIGRTWDYLTGAMSVEPEVRADVYVFAIQTCRDPQAYDVLDLEQWEFRVVPARVVRDEPVKSVGMSFLLRNGAAPLRWAELAEAIEAATRS